MAWGMANGGSIDDLLEEVMRMGSSSLARSAWYLQVQA